jgi:hypothetical protein
LKSRLGGRRLRDEDFDLLILDTGCPGQEGIQMPRRGEALSRDEAASSHELRTRSRIPQAQPQQEACRGPIALSCAPPAFNRHEREIG